MAFGGSSLTIASFMKSMGHNRIVHTAIDLAQTSYWDNVADDALARAGLRDLVQVVEKPSSIALAAMLEAGERFDFCYVDGSHQFEDVFVDFYFVARMLDVNSIVLFDDSTDKHVAKVIKFIRRNYREVFDEINLSEYVTDRSRKLRRYAASLCGKVQLTGFRKREEGNASLRFQEF